MNELQLQAMIRNQRNDVELPFEILKQEYPIYLDGECCGFVDFIIRYNSKRYALEAKSLHGTQAGTSVFWNATKVVAYTKLLNMVEREKRDKYLPAILIPIEAVNKKNLIISVLLEIQLFSYCFDLTKGCEGKIIIVDELSKRTDSDLFALYSKCRELK